jgi:hypothetical protein
MQRVWVLVTGKTVKKQTNRSIEIMYKNGWNRCMYSEIHSCSKTIRRYVPDYIRPCTLSRFFKENTY